MKPGLNRLVDFISEYGREFLNDGTKKRIIDSLNEGDLQTASEVVNSMDENWTKRTKELGMFYIFTDTLRTKDEKSKDIHFVANYIDTCEPRLSHIPVLRDVRIREFGLIVKDESEEEAKGWEIE